MRTKKQMNAEWSRLDNQMKDTAWVIYAALVSACICLVGIITSQYVVALGFVGMVAFGGYRTHLDGEMKNLKREWRNV